MTVELMNPDGLPKPEVYRQMSIATGSRLVFLAGQVARDGDGNPVGAGDFAAQVEQAYLNVGTALAAVGGSFDDVAKLTIYVVDWGPDKYPLLGEGGARGREAGCGPGQADHPDRRRGAGGAGSAGRGRGDGSAGLIRRPRAAPRSLRGSGRGRCRRRG